MGFGGVVVGVGFAVDGSGVGVGGETATFGVARFPVTGPALAELGAITCELVTAAVRTGRLLDAGGWPAVAEGWLLVQAASTYTSAIIEAAQAAGAVRSGVPIWSG